MVLSERPNDTFEGEQIAHAISKMLYTAEIRCLEDGPFGGTRLLLGNSFFGEVLRLSPTSRRGMAIGRHKGYYTRPNCLPTDQGSIVG